MHIITKFSCGDVVYRAYAQDDSTPIPCPDCNGSGRAMVEGKKYTVECPPCFGRGWSDRKYDPKPGVQRMTIGSIRIEHTDSPGIDGETMFDNYKPQAKHEERYMCVESGVGSGTVWSVDDLFATEAEAEDRAKVKVIQTLMNHAVRINEQKQRERDRLERIRAEEAAEESL